MPYSQTCRRHPGVRFYATCPGCAQDQYDTEQRNRQAAAEAFKCPTCWAPNATQDALDFHVEAAH